MMRLINIFSKGTLVLISGVLTSLNVWAQDSCQLANNYDSYVLAMSWQPGFCEHVSYQGVKQECDHLNQGDITINHLTIHGLWPNKQACGIHYGNCSDSPLNLKTDTVKAIAPWMPNFYYSTSFGTHEWNKHGSCQSLDDDDYFLLAKQLVEKFDASHLGDYLRTHLGQNVQTKQMRTELDATLGRRVVSRMRLSCSKQGAQRYLTEIRVQLPKVLNTRGSLDDLVQGATQATRFAGNCGNRFYIEDSGRE
ncbi:ribonuclease T2 family protein [Vibrio nitrifigilis]|uniref:Uncharacterized protein n=1 Tax=Vibrio nitrifigilis TaxID=2789781 RepID=A0ABS0GK11_9VIBR|nr:hypothetical protein [Vibrio nitrifigilis]MBF9002554.1 hypothetical protein [Vibrio nitrifigilis]